MIIAVIVVAVSWVAWPAIREAAADDYLDEFLAYGVANIAPGQTARLHVVTVGIPDVQPAELVIYDRLGLLLPGRAVALDLKFDEQQGIAVTGNRLQFYAEVRFGKQRQGYVIPSLEVMDATGKTILMVADPLG
jgi:hypothetical protein